MNIERPALSTLPRVDVLGVHVSAINMEQALSEITRWVDQGLGSYVCVTGVHGVMSCRSDDRLRRIHNYSGLTTPDGMPMVWAGRYAGVRETSRVYGPDLMMALLARAETRGWTSYFYGGRPATLAKLVSTVGERFPNLEVAGSYSPPFRPLDSQEDDSVVRAINERRPTLVWVGLGTPKQELWMADHVERLHGSILLGVGAAFDICAGQVRQAPRWVQRGGLEWLFRLVQEPRRLWHRYLYSIPLFLLCVLRKPPRRLGQHMGG